MRALCFDGTVDAVEGKRMNSEGWEDGKEERKGGKSRVRRRREFDVFVLGGWGGRSQPVISCLCSLGCLLTHGECVCVR